MRCAQCGEEVEEGHRFCGHCGSAVLNVAAARPQYYEHSGTSPKLRALVALVLTTIVTSPLAWLYGWAQLRVPNAFLSAVLPFAFGFVLALANAMTLKFAKVRSRTLAVRLTFVVVGLAYYISWAAWAALVASGPDETVYTFDAALQPFRMISFIADINKQGAWSIVGIEVKGFALWSAWAVEALIILGLGLAVGLADFSDLPFCERCNRWCRKRPNVLRFWQPDPAAVKDAVESMDLERLARFELVPLSLQLGHWYECDVECCTTCASTNTLDVSLVIASKNTKGKTQRNATKVISNLLLTAASVEELERIGKEAKIDTVS